MRAPYLLLLCLVAQGQDVAIKPRFRQGDSFALDLTRVKEDSRRPERDGRSVTPVNIKVLQAGAEGYVLSWKYGATVMADKVADKQNPIVDAASKFVEELDLHVVLGQEGNYQGLKNEADVMRKMSAMIDTLVDGMKKAEPDPEKWKQVEPLLRQTMSPQFQLASVTRDVQTYFGWYGAELAPGEAVEVPVQQPFPLGGGTLQGKIVLRLNKVEGDLAQLSSATTYDGAVARDLTIQFITKTAKQPMKAEELSQVPTVEMQDEGKYTYDSASGLMREVIVHRRMRMGDALRRSDGWEFRLRQKP